MKTKTVLSSHDKKRLNAFNALSKKHKNLAFFIAASYSPVSITSLIYLKQIFGYNSHSDSNKYIDELASDLSTYSTSQNLLMELEKQDVIQLDWRTCNIHKDFRDIILLQCNDIAKVKAYIYYHYDKNMQGGGSKDLLTVKYLLWHERWDYLMEMLADFTKSRRDKTFDILFSPYMFLKIHENLPEWIIKKTFISVYAKAYETNTDITIFDELFIKHFQTYSFDISKATVLIDVKIMQGDFERAVEIAKISNSPYMVSYTDGIINTIKGDYSSGVTCLEEAIVYYCKILKKKKQFIPVLGSFFLVVSVLKSKQTDANVIALQYIKKAIVGKTEKDKTLLNLLKNIIEEQNSNFPSTIDNLYNSFEQYKRVHLFDATPDRAFIYFATCFTYTLLREYSDDYELEEYIPIHIRNGYYYVAIELYYAMKKNDSLQSIKYIEQSGECKRIIEVTKPVTPFLFQIPSWEKELNALLTLGNTIKKQTNTSITKRIIWLFQWKSDSNTSMSKFTIVPAEQKLNKNGKWSRARVISFKSYLANCDNWSYATDVDRKAVGAIRMATRYQDVHFDLDILLPLFIGYENIYLDLDKYTKIDIVKTEPQLTVSDEGDELKVTIVPSDLCEIIDYIDYMPYCKYVIIKETNTKFGLIEITVPLKNIITIIYDGLRIPIDAKEKFHRAINSVSNILTINSNMHSLANEALSIEPDKRLHAVLLPFGDGIKVEVKSKPIENGSYYKPGDGNVHVMTTVDNKKIKTKRDLVLEKSILDDIVDSCDLLVDDDTDTWEFESPSESLDFLQSIKNIGDSKIVLEWPRGVKFKVTKNVSFDSLNLKIGKQKDWFTLEGKIQISENKSLQIIELLKLMENSSNRFIKLDDGGFLALTKRFYKKLKEIETISIRNKKEITMHPLASIQINEFIEEGTNLKGSSTWKEYIENFKKAQDLNPQIPKDLQITLREYQIDGFKWLIRLYSCDIGACLADDMGLGKTVQALALILKNASKGPSLVIAPSSVCMNWIDEATRFAPTLNVHIFNEVSDRDKTIKSMKKFDLLISSYGLLQQDSEKFIKKEWNCIVLDEAQAIKNRSAKRTKAAYQLNGKFKVVTTGTPIENHLSELWSLFQFINPGLLGSLNSFADRFIIPVERDKNKDKSQRLKKLIQPFILRRLKNQVLTELPTRTEIDIHVEMNGEEIAFYEALRQNAVEQLESKTESAARDGQKKFIILAEIMKLRRACCNSKLIFPKSHIVSSKLEAFGEKLDELIENNHKALVFSQFVDHLAILKNCLEEKNISYQYLDGRTPIKERRKRVNAFQEGEGDVFLISLKAGGTGLNLTAADYVFHMDPWWNPAVEDQASDRIYRIGQKRPVTIYRFIMKNSIEEKIMTLHTDKRDLANSLLDGGDAAGRISADDLMNLLREI